jgi:ribose transport system substrate-binding protein
MGALTVQVALAALRGEPYEEINAIVLSPVNASNLADFLPDPLLDEDFTDVTIGMSVLNLANPFFVQLVAGAQEAADKYGVELVVTDPQDDASRQVTDVENFIAAGFDGIIVTSVDPQAIAPITAGAIEAGIPVVAHTADLGEGNQTALVYAVERDMGLTLGRQIGEWANTHVTDGELQIAVLNYDVLPQVIARREGIIEGAQEVFEGTVTMVATSTAGDPTTGLAAAEIWLQQYPELDAIAGINDGGALGAYQAVIAAGKDDPMTFFVGGIDATDEALAAIASGGSYQASVDQQPSEMGALTVEVVLRALAGLDYELINAIELSPVNASNYADFQ